MHKLIAFSIIALLLLGVAVAAGAQDAAKNILATLNILAFLIHTIQEMIEPAYQRLRRALGARKPFFNDLRALTRYMIFDSWDDLFIFMEDGLDTAQAPP